MPGKVTLQDLVYFGTYWQILDRNPATADITLGGGFVTVRVERSAEGDFFAGIVERLDSSGRVTDVVLAFAGAHGADAIQGESILLGLPLDEAARATALYDSLLADPRYAGATIHVTGHSLGAGYSQYVLGHALATYGVEATDARAEFLGFGAPNWLGSAARHFGVDVALVDSRFTDYTAENDPVLINGVERLGLNHYLPAFNGFEGLELVFNPIAAHHPTTYASALGLPDWLSAGAQAAATAEVSAQFNTGNSIDPDYGPPGSLGLRVDGSVGDDRLVGLDGADSLRGGDGKDVLIGGGGADLFVFAAGDSAASRSAADVILDFSHSQGDRIDLSSLAGLLGDLDFAGQTSAPRAGSVGYYFDGRDTIVAVNSDFDPAAEMLIRLNGRHHLVEQDFLLGGLPIVELPLAPLTSETFGL